MLFSYLQTSLKVEEDFEVIEAAFTVIVEDSEITGTIVPQGRTSGVMDHQIEETAQIFIVMDREISEEAVGTSDEENGIAENLFVFDISIMFFRIAIFIMDDLLIDAMRDESDVKVDEGESQDGGVMIEATFRDNRRLHSFFPSIFFRFITIKPMETNRYHPELISTEMRDSMTPIH